MENKKPTYEDFIATVDSSYKDFINELHNELTDSECKIEVKEAKSGYVVSYIYNKKTILNYVFRKKGLIIRIYANEIAKYMEFLDSLPNDMISEIKNAPVCKRLINPDSCNSKCSMGYDFLLQGERLQKCRNGAFMFLICKENNTYIKNFLKNELKAR